IAAAHNRHADRIEKASARTIPSREATIVGARSGMPLRDDTRAPHVTAERDVSHQAHVGHGRQCCEAVFDLAVESGESIERIDNALWVKLHHIAVRGAVSKFVWLQIAKRPVHEKSTSQKVYRQSH